MTRVRRTRAWVPALLLFLLSVSIGIADDRNLGRAEEIADGVRLYRLIDRRLVDPPAPMSVSLLRLHPSKVDLRSVLAFDRVMGTETVLDMSVRHRAVAGVNAGFFGPNGDPAGLLKIGGELVSEMTRPRGAVGIPAPSLGPLRLLFDRVTADITVRFETSDGVQVVAAAAVDTLQQRDRLTIYTPRYHEDTRTTGGIEWVVRGRPLKVVERRDGVGHTPIPRDGLVLSYGAQAPPSPLDRLVAGQDVQVVPRYTTLLGTDPGRWQGARDIVGGAGLLMLDRHAIDDWAAEDLRAGFDTERHPRTLIGVDDHGEIWLVAVDGRQPDHSVGMNFRELQRLAQRLRLAHVLNLDGGGSTTMVVRDKMVNRPSDLQGPRKVSDALIVLPRGRGNRGAGL